MLRPACETCVYWLQGGLHDVKPKIYGQCRRLPPSIVLTPEGARARWPQTFTTDWCGEHATMELQEAVRG